MRFKFRKNDSAKHSEISTAVAWVGNDAYSIGDDKVIYKWNSDDLQNVKFTDVDTYPTDIDWMPTAKGQIDVAAVGFTDGSFILINQHGKIEKKVADAHKNGSLIALKWSQDGGSLVTCGEDGSIKIWSKTGNLRSNLVQGDKPIYKVAFSPDNDSIIYCTNKQITIKPLRAGQKPIQWKAHEGVVLQCDWNASNNMIVSCGEDCRYKVWDSFGRLLYSSPPYDYVITSVAWAPNGEYFAVGAYGMLKLCDKTGWTYSFEKTECGSLMQVNWSADSTICAGASGNGQVIFGYIVDRSYSYENWDVVLNEDNKIQITDLKSELQEDIDFKERIINMSIGYNHLILNTSTQCYIYNFQNINTPHIFEVRDSVSSILQSPKYFALVQVSQGIVIYNYEGRQTSNPKIPGIKYENLSKKNISISQDILAIVDTTSPKILKFYDILSGQQMNFTLEHSLEIFEIHLNQTEQANDRKISFIDGNKDLYMSPVHKKDVTKLSAMTDSFMWNDVYDILSCISDGRLITWYYPNAIYVDKDLMEQTKYVKEAQEIGRMSQMLTFTGSQVTLRRRDGGLVTLAISPYPQLLFDFCDKQKWEKSIKLCRFVKEQYLWACLASCSLFSRELNAAEIALAAVEAADKVQYINYVKELPSEASKQASLSLFFHKIQEAEQTLLQSKLIYRAIKLNIKLYKWDRAFELTQQYKVHSDTFVAYRQRYLKKIGKEENNNKFAALAKEIGEPDWEKIKSAIKQEKAREQNLR